MYCSYYSLHFRSPDVDGFLRKVAETKEKEKNTDNRSFFQKYVCLFVCVCVFCVRMYVCVCLVYGVCVLSLCL